MTEESSPPPPELRPRVPLFTRAARVVVRAVDERTAIPTALLLAVMAGIGDALTGAETAFTLFYWIPIALATWFRGRGAGYLLTAVSVCFSLTTTLAIGPTPRLTVVVWNHGGELLLFLVLVYLVSALRARLDAETELRRAALDQLRHADRLNTVGKLAAGIAHEIGTPLGVITGRAELIAGEPRQSESAKKNAGIIISQSHRIARIVRQLLDFGRRNATRRDMHDLRQIAAECVELLQATAGKRGGSVIVRGPPTLAFVNKGEIEQVLTNLLMNGIQAVDDGGTVMVEVAHDEAIAIVRVSDDGTGIPPDVLPRIFDPFFTTKDVGEGTGLGLSVAFGIVRDHGGSIDVRSRLGAGTTFTVRLPLREGRRVVPEPEDRQAEEPPATLAG